MADFIVGVGADVSILQSELQRAENLLRQFESAARKSTNIGELQKLNADILTTRNSISQLQSQMNGVAKPTGDATQSLINFSRIAQDAPYGIIGIANNLNPMLESFQRLQKESGSSANALKTMVAGLTGPAGIGVALGVVSSLAVVYSKQISEFFQGPKDKLKDFRDELNKLNADIYKIVGGAQANRAVGLNLVNVITGSSDINQQQEALKKLKALYKDNADIQKVKIDADKVYLDHLVNMASKQEETTNKEKNNTKALSQSYEELKKIEDEKAKKISATSSIQATLTEQERGTTTSMLQNQAVTKINKYYDALIIPIKNKIKELEKINSEFQDQVTSFDTPDKKAGIKREAKDPYTEATKEYEAAQKRNVQLREQDVISQKEYFIESEKIWQEYVNKLKNINTAPAIKKLKELSPKQILEDEGNAELDKQFREMDRKPFAISISGDVTPRKQTESSFKKGQKDMDTFFTKSEDQLKKANKDLNDFAETAAGTATNALKGLWDALQAGENPIDAIGNAFAKLAEDIAFAIIKMEILAALQAALGITTGGVSGVAAGGISSVLGGLFSGAHAEGGITTRASIGMIGEAGPEAILPLSKLGNFLDTTFKAGAMSGGNSNAVGGTFTLRGQDLLVALNRTQKSSNLKGQTISLA